jgi:hypothetical protein
MVGVLERYSNLFDQGERLQTLLEIVPEGSSEVKLRTPRQVQNRLTKAQAAELVAAYEVRLGVLDLAQLFDIHRDTVSSILNRRGVVRRRRGITKELLDETIKDYQAGWSLSRLGTKLAVDPGTVAAALKKAGVPLRPRREWNYDINS